MTDNSNKKLTFLQKHSLKKEFGLILDRQINNLYELGQYIHFLSILSKDVDSGKSEFSLLGSHSAEDLHYLINEDNMKYTALMESGSSISDDRKNVLKKELPFTETLRLVNKMSLEKARLNLRLMGYQVSVKDSKQAIFDTLKRALQKNNKELLAGNLLKRSH